VKHPELVLTKPLHVLIRETLDMNPGVVTNADILETFSGYSFSQIHEAMGMLAFNGQAELCASCRAIISKRTFHLSICPQVTQ
jgi:hypothetical protein